MATIGILGGNTRETTKMFSQICHENGRKILVDSYKITKENSIPIVSIDEITFGVPQIFILQEATNYALDLAEYNYLIVNADHEIIPPASSAGLITYGFNGKASVTASSVADEALQVCIQRGFLTLSGSPLLPQEFSTPCPSSVNPLNVLGAITACAVCDIFM